MAIHATAGLAPFQTTDFSRRSSWTPRPGTPGESNCIHPSTPLLYDSPRRLSTAHAQCYHRASIPSVATLDISQGQGQGSLYDALFSSASEEDRIIIIVRGTKFETFRTTLDQFPETLLGSPGGRGRFYDPTANALVFDRDPASFDAILFFYQSKGRVLARPGSVDEDTFSDEIKFYGLGDDNMEDIAETVSHPELFQGHFAALRRLLWSMLENPGDSRTGKFLARFSMLIIILSVIAFCLDTVPDFEFIDNKYDKDDTKDILERPQTPLWFAIDTAFVIFFTVEYLLRLFASPDRFKFIRSFLAVVDFIAISPYYISLLLEEGTSNVKSFNVVRAIRLFRVVRLFKLYRYSNGLKLLGRALLQSKEKMGTLILCVLMAVVLFSSALFYIEGFGIAGSPFESIPASFWWAIITMSTVGYGDIVPVTSLGKLVAAVCAFSGIILLYILPIPVFVSHFNKIYGKWKQRKRDVRNSVFVNLTLNKRAAPW
ncbi:predicted protein [Nematostella vectensis]|uniref:Potassium channel n=1 Tax=Nematostella vectensis TaxID=45351 RepID=A7SI06_NEMVE|eukprot:XP_001628727.1 predicted protein [Nematostella vectensis]